MDGQILQGSFVSTGASKYIPLRTGVTWMKTYNYTKAATPGDGQSVSCYWQLGMPAGAGISYRHNGAATSVNMMVNTDAFYVYDSSVNTPSIARVASASSSAAQPIVTVAVDPTTFMTDDVSMVRIAGITNAPTICGIDFVVTGMDATHFTLPLLGDVANGATPVAAGTVAGTYRVIPYNPYFYPRNRYVTNVVRGISGATLVYTNVPHGYTVGQSVRFDIPAVNGMTQLNGLVATVTAVGTGATANQFNIDIDTSAFTIYQWPLLASSPSQFGQVVPVGETARSPYENLLGDATLNTAEIGMILTAGVLNPAGANGDTIYWMAGTSFGM